jgi:3-oxoacyl-[acyl-carrier protein] reductase
MSLVVVVFGGTGGIGSSVVRTLTREGLQVYATCQKDTDRAQSVRDIIGARLIPCDIASESDVKTAVNQVIGLEGRIDVLVYAVAGSLKLKPFDQMSDAEIDDDLETGIRGAMRCCSTTLPSMKKQRSGVILLLLSEVAERPPARMSTYAAAKAGLTAFAQSLAAEVQNWNIRVIGISPSFVETPLIRQFPSKMIEIEKDRNGRLLQPEDVAGLVSRIIADRSFYPNGMIVPLRTRQDARP